MSQSDSDENDPASEKAEWAASRAASYDDIPWYRKSDSCSAIILAHVGMMFFGRCVPFVSLLGIFTTIGVIGVCVVVLTGPIYYNKRRKDGTLKTWSGANKVAAVILLILFVGGYGALIYYLNANGQFG